MEVIIKETPITLEIIRKNNKNIYFRFNKNILNVTCNKYVSDNQIIKLIKDNEDSLYKMYKRSSKELENDLFFNYLGKKYTTIYDGVTKDVFFSDDMVFARDEKVLNKFYEKECLRIFESEIKRILPYFNNIPKFSLKIRKMKTRWGVNNVTNKIITLNSELLKKPIHLLDYVIIHELCHFYEANHSKYFWAHVSEYYPKYKEARKELKEV